MKIVAADVIGLLHAADYATLATQSLQLPGYPYATVVPCVVDAANCPIFLISMLAEHTKNAIADPRTSVSVVAPGLGNVQAVARLSMLGLTERFEPSPELVARYLRYQPDAEQYLALDFMFFRLQPQRLRFIAGVGKMGWLEGDDWHGLPSISAADEARVLQALPTRHDIRLLGLDTWGLDYEVAGRRTRSQFEHAASSADEAGQAAETCLARLA